MPLPIEDYALIGDTHTAALVGRDGSIDWLCLPRFDSPACFSALLGDEENGRWRIAPAAPVEEVRRRYRGESLVLETEFRTATGVVRLVDCMPVRDDRADVVRRVEGVEGEVEMQLHLTLRFAYGSATPWVQQLADVHGEPAVVAVAGPDSVCLRGSVLPRGADRAHEARFPVRAGEVVDFSLVWSPSHLAPPARQPAEEVLAATERYWAEWAAQCTYEGPYREAVTRSLITLKALTYDPTGGIVAAPTTSLPEFFGGQRNWDYRYCWLRDATLTLWALLGAGYREEAASWRRWLLRTVAGDPEDLQIVYGVAGERLLPEVELPWLAGYASSAPVRIGNGAALQYQADVVGEVLDALHHARVAGLDEDEFSWPLQVALLDYLEDNWTRPDAGMWEVRGPARIFTHSRVLMWVAFDRAVRAVTDFGREGPVERWEALRDEVRAEVLREGWSDELGSFTQYYGGRTVDASLLVLPMVGFLDADDERMKGTVDLIERTLRRGRLVYRYESDARHDGDGSGDSSGDGSGDRSGGATLDGLPPGEYAFLPCSFWLVDVYARSGRLDDATALFEHLLSLCNDVGLLAEEYDPDGERMAGNFPQAFSHLSLVAAAYTLAGRMRT